MQRVVSWGEVALRSDSGRICGTAEALLPRLVHGTISGGCSCGWRGGPWNCMEHGLMVGPERSRRPGHARSRRAPVTRLCSESTLSGVSPRALPCDRPSRSRRHSSARPAGARRYGTLPCNVAAGNPIPRLPRKSPVAGQCATFRPRRLQGSRFGVPVSYRCPAAALLSRPARQPTVASDRASIRRCREPVLSRAASTL